MENTDRHYLDYSKFHVSVVISIVFVFLVAVLIIVIVGVYFLISFSTENKNFSISYRVNSFNPRTNESFFSIIHSNKLIATGKYICFKDTSGNFISVHKMAEADEEYECYGKCFCLDQTEENSIFSESSIRRSVSVLQSGIFFLISSLSVTVAISVAKIYFNDVCSSKYYDSCSKNQIVSEVEDCKKVEFGDSTSKDELTEKSKSKVKREMDEIYVYECHGHCWTKYINSDEKAREFAERFMCEKYKINKEIFIHSYEIHGKKYSLSSFAIMKFRKTVLSPFCHNLKTYSVEKKYSYDFGRKTTSSYFDIHICVGGGGARQPNAWCKRFKK